MDSKNTEDQAQEWTSMLNAIKDSDLKIIFGYMIKKMESIEEGGKFTSKQYDELITANSELKQKTKSLERKVQEQEDEIQRLQQGRHVDEQYTRRNNIEVFGLEQNDGEDPYQLVAKTARFYDKNFQTTDIEYAHRLPTKNRNRPPSIIAVLKNRRQREDLLDAMKKSKRTVEIKQDQITQQCKFPNRKVFLTENLSAYYKKLLFEAKNLAKDKGYKFVWYDKCQVKVRKEAKEDGKENSTIIVIKNEKDLKLIV